MAFTLSHTFALSLSISHFLSLFLFAFRAGHLVAPDSIINCALHSIYLSCFFSLLGVTLICYTWRMRVFLILKPNQQLETARSFFYFVFSLGNSFISVTTIDSFVCILLEFKTICVESSSFFMPHSKKG